MNTGRGSWRLGILALLSIAPPAMAAVAPTLTNYQSVLRDASGAPLSGSGTISDGSGPGSYASMGAVFHDFGSVWLEVRIGGETLTPRT